MFSWCHRNPLNIHSLKWGIQRSRVTMAAPIPTVVLNTGYKIPVLGLGANIPKKGAVLKAVKTALECGYRMIDTAWLYQSEWEVGEAISTAINSGIVRREDLFITSKLWNTFHEPDKVEPVVREALLNLKIDYLDLYMMHYPMAWREPEVGRPYDLSTVFKPADIDFVDTWRAMEGLVDKGLVRSIGVCNFNITQLKRLLSSDNLKYKPANVQVEIHPYFHNTSLVNFCKENGITVTAFTPLAKGGQEYLGKPTPQLLDEEILLSIARKYNKTPAQIALRWGIQRGISLVPKSATPERIAENINLFDFELTDTEMKSVSSLNRDLRLVKVVNFKTMPEYPFN